MIHSMGALTRTLLIFGLFTGAGDAAAQRSGKLPVVGLSEFVSASVSEEVRDGVVRGLAHEGFVDGKTVKIEFQNAQGDLATATSIIQRFREQKVDVMVVQSSPNVSIAYNMIKDVGAPPIVFAMVNSAYAMKLARSATDKPAYFTGVQNPAPIADGIRLIRESMPHVRKLGVPYNPGEANSPDMISRTRNAIAGTELVLVEAAVTRADEVQMATQSVIARGAEVILMLNDNTVHVAAGSLLRVSHEAKKPVICYDPGMVTRGALGCAGLAWQEGGFEAGKMAAAILRGTSPKDIPIGSLGEDVGQKNTLVLNTAVAKLMGVQIPQATLKRATKIATEFAIK